MPELPNDEEMRAQLLELISREAIIPSEKLTDDATLEGLGVQSLDMVMVLMAVEEKYNVYLPVDAELSNIKTLSQLLDLFVVRIRSAPPADQRPPEMLNRRIPDAAPSKPDE